MPALSPPTNNPLKIPTHTHANSARFVYGYPLPGTPPITVELLSDFVGEVGHAQRGAPLLCFKSHAQVANIIRGLRGGALRKDDRLCAIQRVQRVAHVRPVESDVRLGIQQLSIEGVLHGNTAFFLGCDR